MELGLLVFAGQKPHLDSFIMIIECIFSLVYFLDYVSYREYYRSFGNKAAIESEMERRLTIFRPTFELLVSLVSELS